MLKKILCALLALAVLVPFAACNKEPNTDEENNGDNSTPAVQITDSLELLNNVWALYGDDEKFPVAGGDFENANMEGPGKYNIADAESVQAILNFPASEIAKIDDAASLMHMMNANTFTCGVFRTVEGTDVSALVETIKTQVSGTQWMCGFPDKMIIATVGDYILSAYGNGELIDNLKAKLTEAYPTASVVCDQPLA